MKKGFFSHQLCYRRSLLNKHILYLTFDNKVDNILPFQREVSLTTFCEGVLFVVSPGFEQEKEEFCRILREQLSGNPLLTVGEAIIHNPVYLRNMADDIAPCSLYTVTSINWATVGESTLNRLLFYLVRKKYSIFSPTPMIIEDRENIAWCHSRFRPVNTPRYIKLWGGTP